MKGRQRVRPGDALPGLRQRLELRVPGGHHEECGAGLVGGTQGRKEKSFEEVLLVVISGVLGVISRLMFHFLDQRKAMMQQTFFSSEHFYMTSLQRTEATAASRPDPTAPERAHERTSDQKGHVAGGGLWNVLEVRFI